MNRRELPVDYREIAVIDLDKNRREKTLVNVLSFALFAAVLLAGFLLQPLSGITAAFAGKIWALAGMLVVYVVLHEAVHGLMIYLCSRVKPRFGMQSVYFYAASSVYFDKKSYLCIAIAPLVLLGALLLLLHFLLPPDWFWVLLCTQAMNFSGAAGDLYCFVRVVGFPKEILIQDSGVDMRIYAPDQKG